MTQSNQESPAPAPKDVGGIRTSPVDPSPTAVTTERTHGVQDQHVAAHTPGPWSVDDTEGLFIVCDEREELIAEITSNVPTAEAHFLMRANAARIVACVNACEGMDDPAVEVRGAALTVAAVERVVDRNYPHRAACRDLAEAVEMALSEARGIPSERGDNAALRSRVAELEAALREIRGHAAALAYFIGNPSAWGSYDDETSERLRPIEEDITGTCNAALNPTLARAPSTTKGA